VEYEEKDAARNQENAHEMIHKSGQMGVPVTEIDGEIVVGFDEEKLRELLNIK
jgi:glutaredoxin